MRWRLTTKHYHMDILLEPGTEVGDGTNIAWAGPPSLNMEPVDEEAKQWVRENPNKYAKAGIPIPIEILQPPAFPSPGQRVGGQGPKLDPSQVVYMEGQGPRTAAGDVVSHDMLEQRLVEKKIGLGA